MNLRPTDGHILAGNVVNPHRFSATLPTGGLLKIVRDPRDAENEKKQAMDRELQEILMVRQEVQRSFQGKKQTNVGEYASYILNVEVEGRDGLVPHITLWTDRKLSISDDGLMILIPWEVQLVPIDGDTQLAARFEAANRDRRISGSNVSVDIIHGKSSAFAQQCFYDLNSLGIRPAANLAAAMDQRDPISHIVRELERSLPFLNGRVNLRKASLGPKDTELVSFLSLRTFVATVARGAGGVQYTTKPVPIKDQDIPFVQRTAIAFLEVLHERCQSAMEDRTTKLLLSPTIFCSLGALVTSLVQEKDPERFRLGIERTVRGLEHVNWDKSSAWVKVAGRYNKKGQVTMGGAKQSIYAVLAALNDTKNENYNAIRLGASATPAEANPESTQPAIA
jgi:DNA-sulfur modification-associated